MKHTQYTFTAPQRFIRSLSRLFLDKPQANHASQKDIQRLYMIFMTMSEAQQVAMLKCLPEERALQITARLPASTLEKCLTALPREQAAFYLSRVPDAKRTQVRQYWQEQQAD